MKIALLFLWIVALVGPLMAYSQAQPIQEPVESRSIEDCIKSMPPGWAILCGLGR